MNSSAQGDGVDLPYPICEFGEFRLDARHRSLARGGGPPIPVTARVLDVLIYLVRHRGALIRRDDLIDAVWPDADVEPNNLNQHIAKLRRLLGERPGQNRFIETVAGRGYRFIADVRFAPQDRAREGAADPIRNEKAREQFRQAQRLMQRPAPDNFARAAALLESVVALEPGFAEAWAWLADVDLLAVNVGHSVPGQLERAKRRAEHALQLRPGLAWAHAVLGVIAAQQGVWLTAESHFLQALCAESPGAPEARTPALAMHASFVLEQVGHSQRALQQLREAYPSMPEDPRMLMNLAMAHLPVGLDAQAVEYAQLAIGCGYPEKAIPMPLIHLHAASRAGRYAEAAEHAACLLPGSLQGDEAIRVIYRGFADRRHREPAIAAAVDLLGRLPPPILVSSGMPALLMEWFTQLGRLDLAFDVAGRALDSAAEMRSSRSERRSLQQTVRPPNWQMLWLPELLPVRRDPRFRALAKRLGFIGYWHAHGPPDCPAARLSCAAAERFD